ncbi:M48 family metallopeptidase [Candidatus Woesebacteria bacterium]|nr:M48 family metallopeptidase [Candidatus Woesebacteria bacterium]
MFDMQAPTISFETIEDARSKRLKLRINRQGTVVVTVPRHTPRIIINRFVNQNLSWIEQQKATVSHAKVLPEDQVLLFGKTFTIVVVYEKDLPSGCTIKGKQLEINTLTPNAKLADSKVQLILNRFLRTTASHYILQRTPVWGKKMEIQFQKIQLRQQQSRWGSCSSSGALNFNWRLVHVPPAVVDYVIIHELAHRVEMNHSARFWNIVAKYDPAYQQHRGWLKREGRWVFPDSLEANS